jgi:predicted acylesterase/phospholipase RssA
MRALSLPGCACRGAFQFAVMARLAAAGERFDLVAGASSGSVCGALVVAGLAEEGPAIARSLTGAPIVSTRYLPSERSIFGLGRILRDALRRYLPEDRLYGTEAELLVATTHAGRYARTLFPRPALATLATIAPGALVIHSNRARRDLHEVILASCYLPILHAVAPRLDGELHLDGAVADNTLIDALIARGADDITVVTPFLDGAVARTMFAPERPLAAHADVRLRVISPARPLSLGRFDFSPERMEEALVMPHREHVIEKDVAARRSSA